MSIIFDVLPQLDHAAICVRALSKAKQYYSQQLGFTFSPDGKHESYGTQNCVAWFRDDTYLELLTYFDKDKAGWLVDFLYQHEGAFFFVLKVASIEKVAQRLRKIEIDVADPIPGSIKHETENLSPVRGWKTLFLPPSSSLGKMLFFIEYPSTEAPHPFQKYSSHFNSSTRLSKVYIAAKDPGQLIANFERLGFVIGPAKEMKKFNATSKEIPLGKKTSIVLLSPTGSDEGPLTSFLNMRGEGVFGLALEVDDLEKTKKALQPQTTVDQNNLWIPPEVTKGVWMEFYQN